VVINCASYGNHYSQTDTEKIIKANCNDLIKLCNICRNKRLINLSSSSVHLAVQTVYSSSKQLGESILNSYNNPNFSNVRPFTVFGEGDSESHLIPTIIRHLKSGERMKLVLDAEHDYIHIDDFVHALFCGKTEIGSGVSYSNIQIVNILQRISGLTLDYESVESLRPYDCKGWVCMKPVKTAYIINRLRQTYAS
jgi:nucleoside-diphosphate-sugar epimerase